MPHPPLRLTRLQSHRLTGRSFERPEDAAAWLGALQAQEHLAARWALGARCDGGAGIDEAAVAAALNDGRLVRTWAMRGTLQIAAAQDVRWLVDLVGPPALARHAAAQRKLGVDEALMERAAPALADILAGGQTLTRAEVFAGLQQRGIATDGQRGYYMLARAAWGGLLCLGPMRAKQETYTLLAEWAPNARPRPREQALAELARRYFQSHGPATLADFAWWSGLPMADSRAALESVRGGLEQQTLDGQTYWAAPNAAPRALANADDTVGSPVGTGSTAPAPGPTAGGADAGPAAHLLAAFDEYVLGYAHRGISLDSRHSPRVITQNGMFYPTILVGGEIVGTWKRTLNKASVAIHLSPFAPLSRSQRQAVEEAADGYAKFVGLECVVVKGGYW